ncbi:MAG TPA: DUF6448 family protein [Burkholderiales bacterium]|nr:DUF6448 family protein [Burkholderiales bacterium]
MTRAWMSSKQMQSLAIIGLIVVERFARHLLGLDQVSGLAGETGLLLLWGIGHCDTLDGPLVVLAKKALDEKNVNLVLPWVRAEDAGEIRHAFDHALAVRGLGPEARSLADRHFFETLVRIHRAGEGAPFTGLKPAGLDLGPAVPAADRALRTGSVEEVVKLLVDAVRTGVRAHFHATVEKQAFDVNDVAAGREYVEAYVPYVHYVERLWDAATGPVHGHHPEHGAQPQHAEARHALHEH